MTAFFSEQVLSLLPSLLGHVSLKTIWQIACLSRLLFQVSRIWPLDKFHYHTQTWILVVVHCCGCQSRIREIWNDKQRRFFSRMYELISVLYISTLWPLITSHGRACSGIFIALTFREGYWNMKFVTILFLYSCAVSFLRYFVTDKFCT